MLVTASGGFSLIKHYCNCAMEVTGSLVIEPADCNESEEVETCCLVQIEKETSYCQTRTDQINSHHQCENTNNCCTSKATFLKTDDFDYSQEQKRSFGFIVAFVNVLEANNLQKKQSCIQETTSYTSDLPPPEYGKKLLVILNQFKIASPID